METYRECAYFDFGNFRFKLPIERIFREEEDGTVIFMTKTMSFVKIRCRSCDYVTLIPTYGEFRVSGPVYCEDCGKLILTEYMRARYEVHRTFSRSLVEFSGRQARALDRFAREDTKKT